MGLCVKRRAAGCARQARASEERSGRAGIAGRRRHESFRVQWELKSVSRTQSTPLVWVVRKPVCDLEPRYGIEP